MDDSEVIYEDKFIVISSSSLNIKRYYLTGASKIIPTASISQVWRGNDEALGLNCFKKKTMGLAFSDVWWALRWGREFDTDDSKNMVVKTRDNSEAFRHGFSVERPDKLPFACHRFARAPF